MNQPQKIELTLPAHVEFSGFLREVSKRFFEHIGFNEPWVHRLEVVLDELFCNAVEYGSDVHSQVYLTFLFDDHDLVMRIEDEGRGEHKLTAAQLSDLIDANQQALLDAGKFSGRGLALISSFWSDQFQIADSLHGGLMVALKKSLASQETVRRIHISLGDLEDHHLRHFFDLPTAFSKIEIAINQLLSDELFVLNLQQMDHLDPEWIRRLNVWNKAIEEKKAHLLLTHVADHLQRELRLAGVECVYFEEREGK